jgi:hypothetical protein
MTDALGTFTWAKSQELFYWRDVLLNAGWEAIASDLLGEVAARLDRPPGGGVWTLAIDRAGRFRFRSTRASSGSVDTHQLRSGCLITLAVEDRQVLAITGRLDSSADLESILQELAQLVGDRPPSAHPGNLEDNSA